MRGTTTISLVRAVFERSCTFSPNLFLIFSLRLVQLPLGTRCSTYSTCMNKNGVTFTKWGFFSLMHGSSQTKGENREWLWKYRLFTLLSRTSLRISASPLRRFCIWQLSSTSTAQVCTKLLVADDSRFHFILLGVLLEAFNDLFLSPSLDVVRKWYNLRVHHGSFRSGSFIVFLEE